MKWGWRSPLAGYMGRLSKLKGRDTGTPDGQLPFSQRVSPSLCSPGGGRRRVARPGPPEQGHYSSPPRLWGSGSPGTQLPVVFPAQRGKSALRMDWEASCMELSTLSLPVSRWPGAPCAGQLAVLWGSPWEPPGLETAGRERLASPGLGPIPQTHTSSGNTTASVVQDAPNLVLSLSLTHCVTLAKSLPSSSITFPFLMQRCAVG